MCANFALINAQKIGIDTLLSLRDYFEYYTTKNAFQLFTKTAHHFLAVAEED